MQNQQAALSSRTQTLTVEPVLHLRPSTSETKPKKKSQSKVRWTEDVVDNEHMNKKKTKICCIFHPQREFGESSDSLSDSSSDSSDSSGDEGDHSNKFNDKHTEDKNGDKSHDHDPSEDEHDHSQCNHGKVRRSKKSRSSGPNAYEKQPHYKNASTVPESAI